MVVDAFIYMYFVGAGTSAGVATVGLLTWKIYQKMNHTRKQVKRGIV